MARDLNEILGDWPFDPTDEARNVRRIVGQDGRPKVQVRIRGGALQWELDGRPDGTRPHGFDSLLQYFQHLLQEHLSRHGGQKSFHLATAQTEAASEEMTDYYQRRVTLFVLGDFERARDDALHNLAMMDFLKAHVPDEARVMEHERYRPFVIMDRARAEAAICVNRKEFRQAIEMLDLGIREITDFYHAHQRDDLLEESQELDILRNFKSKLRKQYDIPLTGEEQGAQLEQELRRAIEHEDYEHAARLRDQIAQHHREHGNKDIASSKS